MPQFFELPREIRDMIYTTILTAEQPTPSLEKGQWRFKFRAELGRELLHNGEYGCAYSIEQTPTTCTNVLRCNQQVHAEMTAAIERARRKEMVAVKLDCIAEDESFHYFTWLAMPLVKTSWNMQKIKSRIMPGWAGLLVGNYLPCSHRSGLVYRSPSTAIHQFWIDVRPVGNRLKKMFTNGTQPERTSWAVCAALKRILDKGPHFSSKQATKNEITIDELVLNVVTPPNVPPVKFLDQDFAMDEVKDGVVHPHTVAKELIDVWSKIWTGHSYKGIFYQILLQRIKRVRVCVNGETRGVRELRRELERGQEERRRIAARVGG